MMEWNGIGIKGGEDVVEALTYEAYRDGDAGALLEIYGDRIATMMAADTVEHLIKEMLRLRRERDEARAEAERLRGLLRGLYQDVRGLSWLKIDDDTGMGQRLAEIEAELRAALRGEEK